MEDASSAAGGGPGSLAGKLDLLFRRTRPPGQAREFSYDQVAEGIAARGGSTISANYIYMLRRGIRDNPTKRHLEALAEFFSVPPAYFFEHAADPRDTALPDHGEPVDLGSWHTARALAHLLLGEHQRAETLGRRAVLLLHDHLGPEAVRALTILGDAVAAQGRTAEAMQHYRQAVRIAEGVRVPSVVAELFRELADRIDRLEPTEAATLYRKALDAARVPGSPIALDPAQRASV